MKFREKLEQLEAENARMKAALVKSVCGYCMGSGKDDFCGTLGCLGHEECPICDGEGRVKP